MRYLLLSIICLLIFQSDDTLKTPTIDEFLHAVSSLNEPDDDILKIVTDEFRMRYEDTVTVDQLTLLEPYLLYEENIWHRLLLSAWLRDNQPDLSLQNQWMYGEYRLTVQAVDLTGDGVEEYPAELVFQSENIFRALLIISSENRVLDDVDLWFSASCPLQLSCSGDATQLNILDVTGDAIPEWLISRGNCASGRCHNRLHIWSWQQDAFVDISDEIFMSTVSGGGGAGNYPREGGWAFENRDEDTASEIIQTEYIHDNRNCDFTRTTYFGWNGQAYEAEQITEEFEDSIWCDLRLAHFAMAEMDMPTAITHYEHFLAAEPVVGLENLWTYAETRLEAAYAIEADSSDAVALCAALYEAASSYRDSSIGSYLENNDYHVPETYGGGDFNPSEAGCNIHALWEADVISRDFDRWEVTAIFGFDINRDNRVDTITWVEPLNLNVLQLSDGRDLVTDVPSPDSYMELYPVTLPDNSGGLIIISFNPSVVCHMDSMTSPGFIQIWQLVDDELFGVTHQLCNDQTLEETRPSPSELYADGQLVFMWDEGAGRFVRAEPQPAFDPLGCQHGAYGFCGNLNEPEAALNMLAEIQDPNDGLRYYHALVLEVLNRDEEARLEYAAIFENTLSPDWRSLAALHLHTDS